jgi:hypothetical protein
MRGRISFFVAMLLLTSVLSGSDNSKSNTGTFARYSGESIAFMQSISSLEYSDPLILRQRLEVKENLQYTSKGMIVEPVFRKYRLHKKDTFFSVMTKTMLDHDTLSSINQLSSLWDVDPGEVWIIPNVRGIASQGDREHLAKKYKVNPENIHEIPGRKKFYFIVGRSFPQSEKNFFNLTAFLRPVAGLVSSTYGTRKDPFSSKNKFHKGIDIACAMGTSIIAASSGKIIFAGQKGAYGNLIIIEHANGYRTLYGHLSSFQVKSGDKVRRGQLIALSGNTGRTTGPHLHFEVSRKGRPTKPHFDIAQKK